MEYKKIKDETLYDRWMKIAPTKKDIVPYLEFLTGASAKKKNYEPGLTEMAFAIPVAGRVGRGSVSYLKKLVNMRRKGVDMRSFFQNLGWNKGGKNLWKKIEDLNPKILTGGKNLTSDSVTEGKHGWVRSNLNLSSNNVIVQTRKEMYASPNAVLIDDLPMNVKKFKKAGGNAILHTNDKKTIKELNKMLSKNNSLQIYVDLDGVLVDLKGGIKKFKLNK